MEYLSKNPSADRQRLINQVAEGLVYLHGREPPVVHSDIKPANVLVSDEGNAKLCDFGISKLVLENPSGFTTTASVKGTLRYSSAEMLDGQSTTRSDVWAFGMLILHVMTSKIPYAEILSDVKVILAIMGGQRPLPENYSDLPSTDPLWDVMGECWCEDPMKRPTMTEVFDKLHISDVALDIPACPDIVPAQLRLEDNNPAEQQAPRPPEDINSAEQALRV
ncbi:hypothetical protein FRC01_004901 [Tulasnella sp. 417]|nr:hypothetical protein FRC01_004901 [Tulasnella sp. 417]